jgi:RNA polymerase sigma factor (TIGR02999 family)
MLNAHDFESLLPWYLNGTVSDGERALVAAYLQAHPEEQARVRWNESLRGAIKDQADELPEDLGLQRVLTDVRRGDITRLLAAVEEPAREAAPRVGAGVLPAAEAPGQITQLLSKVRSGDTGARDALFALAYGELKKLAHARLFQGGRSHELDTTGLVAEAYIRFKQSSELRSEDRRSFFAFASQVMRNVIVDTARARLAQRRGGGAAELTLSTLMLDHLSSSGEQAILDVHEALLVLEEAEPRLAKLVEMRYYGGYTEAEIAESLGVTERTVQRDWNKARLLLRATLQRRQ